MADVRIPKEKVKGIFENKSIPIMIRVLHWYYFEMYGWTKTTTKGYFKIKSFKILSKMFEVDKGQLNRVINKLESYGFFSVDFKNKTFYLSNQKLIKFKEEKLTKISTNKVDKNINQSCQICQQKVDNIINHSCQNCQLLISQTLELQDNGDPLVHSLRHYVSTLINNNNGDEAVMDDNLKEATEIIRSSKHFSKKTILQFSRILYDYGMDAFRYAIHQMNKKELPRGVKPMQYLYGILRNYDPDEDKIEETVIPQAPPDPDEPELDPIWGNFLPYKKYFKDCKKAFNLKPNDSDEYTDEELEALDEIDNFFINEILPKVRTLFPGYEYDPKNPKLKEVFKEYEELTK